jgi:hypothetical protein
MSPRNWKSRAPSIYRLQSENVSSPLFLLNNFERLDPATQFQTQLTLPDAVSLRVLQVEGPLKGAFQMTNYKENDTDDES